MKIVFADKSNTQNKYKGEHYFALLSHPVMRRNPLCVYIHMCFCSFPEDNYGKRLARKVEIYNGRVSSATRRTVAKASGLKLTPICRVDLSGIPEIPDTNMSYL